MTAATASRRTVYRVYRLSQTQRGLRRTRVGEYATYELAERHAQKQSRGRFEVAHVELLGGYGHERVTKTTRVYVDHRQPLPAEQRAAIEERVRGRISPAEQRRLDAKVDAALSVDRDDIEMWGAL